MEDKDKEYTTIKVFTSSRDYIARHGVYGETLAEILGRLIEELERKRKKWTS
jgi:hypothetical protein